MSYQSEHLRMKPVLDLARQLDIVTNPAPAAIFEAGSSGFQVWCTPDDRPKGWSGIEMFPGTFSKPCEYVGGVHWKWDEDRIAGLEIETSAYALADQFPERYTNLNEPLRGDNRRTIYNRDEDIAWLQEKVAWLFQKAEVDLPPFEYEPASLLSLGPYRLAHYRGGGEDYLVIVSPGLDPEDFCLPGYAIAQALDIGDAGEFPADVVLRPEEGALVPEPEPDEGPLVEPFENPSRIHDDDWLEAGFEERVSGWEE